MKSIDMVCTPDLCTGCETCANVCPSRCISMNYNSEGFLEPVIDKSQCTGCLQCQKKCPVLHPLPLQNASPDVYACWSLNDEIRMRSSSGGLFSVIANEILAKGGVVFGVLFDEELKIRHDFAETEEKLSRFRTSKYAQSIIGDSYRNVKSFLQQDRAVLFSGTPCQVAGLYAYLGDLGNHPNLTTCDLVCHGAASPGVFESNIQWMRNKRNTPVTDLCMRDKSRAWHNLTMRVISPDAADRFVPWENDPFFFGFIFNILIRRSCSKCCFTKEDRYGDFTLADFWGIGKDVPFAHDTTKGVSLLLVNSGQGRVFFESFKNQIFYEERTMEEAKKENMSLFCPSSLHPKREQFFHDYRQYPFDVVAKRYLRPKYRVIKKLLKMILGPKVISVIRKFIK